MNSFSNQNGPNYKPIRSSKSQDGDESVECQDDGIEVYMFLPRWARNASFLSGNFKIHFISCLPWVTVCILLALLGYSHVSRPLNAQLLYSPVQNLIKYDTQVFHYDIDTRYQDYPSPDVDKAWEDLFDFGGIKLNSYEAARIPNKTWPIAQEPGSYYATLSVFHSLHCLNNIRKALYPSYYDPVPILKEGHMVHCLDLLRQSIMCSSDISVTVWQWVDRDGKAEQLGSVPHTCRNFEAIREWALERRMDVPFDATKDLRADPLAGEVPVELQEIA